MQASETQADIEMLGEYSGDTHQAYMQCSLERWNQLFSLIQEVSSSSSTDQQIRQIARRAYQVRRSSSFKVLLQNLCRNGKYHMTKIMEKLGKVAKFYRAAITIIDSAIHSNTSCTCFKLREVKSMKRRVHVLRGRRPVQLQARVPFLRTNIRKYAAEAQHMLDRWNGYVVHAEMLLLIFYEQYHDIKRIKDYIGTSKRSCFLCSSFIELHGIFSIEGCHQQLYCLWTLPPCIEFSSCAAKDRFSETLLSLDRRIRQKLEELPKTSFLQSEPYHPESVANLSRSSLIRIATASDLSEVPEELAEGRELQQDIQTLSTTPEGVCVGQTSKSIAQNMGFSQEYGERSCDLNHMAASMLDRTSFATETTQGSSSLPIIDVPNETRIQLDPIASRDSESTITLDTTSSTKLSIVPEMRRTEESSVTEIPQREILVQEHGRSLNIERSAMQAPRKKKRKRRKRVQKPKGTYRRRREREYHTDLSNVRQKIKVIKSRGHASTGGEAKPGSRSHKRRRSHRSSEAHHREKIRARDVSAEPQIGCFNFILILRLISSWLFGSRGMDRRKRL